MNIKKFCLFILFLSLNASLACAINQRDEAAKTRARAILSVTGAAALVAAAQKAGESKLIQDIGEKCNISPEDWICTIGLSTALAGMPLIANKQVGQAAVSFAWRTPIYALIIGGFTSKTFNAITSRISGVGKFLGGCSNEECKGMCNNCKVRKTMYIIASCEYIVRPVCDIIERYIRAKLMGDGSDSDDL